MNTEILYPNTTSLQIFFISGAMIAYFAAMTLSFAGLILKKERLFFYSTAFIGLGVLVQGAALGIRWYSTGHGPYYKIFEMFSSNIWVILVIYLIVVYFNSNYQIMSLVIMPVSLFIMGWVLISDPQMLPLPPTFKSPWLVAHVLFAYSAFTSILIASGLAVAQIIRRGRGRNMNSLRKLPSIKELDSISTKLVGFGFVFYGLFILAGALWADQAWGRFWSWDPVETASLFTWLMYGAYLHLKITYKIKEDTSQKLIIGILLISMIFHFGIAYIVPSIHSDYLKS